MHVPFSTMSTDKRLKLFGALGGVAIPVGFVIQQHVGWEHDKQGKRYMLTLQSVFWSSLAMGLYTFHRAFKNKLPFINSPKIASPWARSGLFLAGGLFAAQGFTSGQWIAKKLFPKKPESEVQKPETQAMPLPSNALNVVSSSYYLPLPGQATLSGHLSPSVNPLLGQIKQPISTAPSPYGYPINIFSI